MRIAFRRAHCCHCVSEKRHCTHIGVAHAHCVPPRSLLPSRVDKAALQPPPATAAYEEQCRQPAHTCALPVAVFAAALRSLGAG